LESKVPIPVYSEVKAEIKEKIRKEKQMNGSDEDEDDITVIGKIKTTEKKKKKRKTKSKVREAYEERLNQFRNSENIHVAGTDIPKPVNTWDMLRSEYGLSEQLLSSLPYPRPTPVQMQTIPVLLQSRDLLASAPTGSGKTAAFLLPILHHLQEPRNGGYRALVVVPTKELAIQICNECSVLAGKSGLRAHMPGKLKDQKGSVKHDILVSPPNRLVHLLAQGSLSLDKLQWLVVDEADKMFEAGVTGFREQLAAIHRGCAGAGAGVRRAMFSATLGPEVETWCKLNLDNMVKVRVGAANSAGDTISQRLVYTGTEAGKLLEFRNIVREGGIQPPVLVFVQTKERATELFKELLYDGINVDVIHSERSEQQRENTVRAFRSGDIWVLICTELMGRGIDFKGVNLVINYDFPPSAVSYIHRIGRTGRAGRAGKAVTFFTEQDRTILRTIAEVMKNSGCDVPGYMLSMKKASRDDRKKLASKAPKRDGITSKYEKDEMKKKEEMIAASKKRKLEGKIKKVNKKIMKMATNVKEDSDLPSDASLDQ